MKKFKNALLSVLLFSFTFLVVHDYMMADLGVSTYEVESLAQKSIVSKAASDTLGAISHLHDTVHVMIATDVETAPTASLTLNNNPSYTLHRFSSNNNFVLERPPLS